MADFADSRIRALQQEFANSQPAMRRARSRLFALIPPHRNYLADIAEARFAVRLFGDEIASGPMQVIGSYVLPEDHGEEPRNGTWLWSWDNPSLPEKSWREMAEYAGTLLELERLGQLEFNIG